MKPITELSRQEKIQLLIRIQAGKVEIKDGQIIDKEILIAFEKEGLHYFDNQCTKEVNLETLDVKTLIILPCNGRDG